MHTSLNMVNSRQTNRIFIKDCCVSNYTLAAKRPKNGRLDPMDLWSPMHIDPMDSDQTDLDPMDLDPMDLDMMNSAQMLGTISWGRNPGAKFSGHGFGT